MARTSFFVTCSLPCVWPSRDFADSSVHRCSRGRPWSATSRIYALDAVSGFGLKSRLWPKESDLYHNPQAIYCTLSYKAPQDPKTEGQKVRFKNYPPEK
jgi:hypothetical protein